MKKALLFKKLDKGWLQCLTCQRYCKIAPGKVGFCLTRFNKKGELWALNWDLLLGSPQADPIEKKPLYHFLPGEKIFSIGSFGCNYRCKQCLNWHCSWGEPATSILKKVARGEAIKNVIHATPGELVSLCAGAGLKAIAYTYNEPTIWLEYALAIAKQAKKRGIKNVFVTNGGWSKETLDAIGPYLDAANIDFKGFSAKTYSRMGGFWGKLLPMAKYAQEKHGIFLELTTVLIPGINDSSQELKKMAKWIADNLGEKTPWHISRYSPNMAPDEKFAKILPPTKDQLLKAYDIGKKTGLEFIYIWAPGVEFEGGVFSRGDTICPKCKTAVIKRGLWKPKILAVNKRGECTKCGEDLNIRFN